MTVLECIRRIRGVSHKQIAAQLNIHPVTLGYITRGMVRDKDRRTLSRRAISEYFGLPFDTLIKDVSEETILSAIKATTCSGEAL